MSEFTKPINEVIVEDRIRTDMGSLDDLASSIKELGLIEPIVLGREGKLIAGERRLRALKLLGQVTLIHGKHFIYNDEVDDMRLKAMEIEENVKRKELTWTEQVLGKKRLLEIMQTITGGVSSGRRETSFSTASTSGFGVNKLAAMLGESNAQTSKDLELAELITVAPQLGRAETKEAARRQATLAVLVATGLQKQATNPQPQSEKLWTLYEGDFNVNALHVPDNSVDLVVVDPPYGEDVSGVGANSRDLLAKSFIDSEEYTKNIISEISLHGYRILREHSFIVCFFGFAVYQHLVDALRHQGFEVDTTPLVWVKSNVINTSPYTRYGRSYEPVLFARKGQPKLVRPSQKDVIEIPTVISTSNQETKLYHAQKPVALMEKFILDMTIPGATVVDFCAGSGSTGVAAVQQKRRVVLFEKDLTACQIIKSRLGAL